MHLSIKEKLSGWELESEREERYGIWPSINSKGRIYIRPLLDPEMEKELYGLDMKGGIDFTRLDEHFPENSFDIIFASHLGNVCYCKIQESKERIMRVLAHGGEIVLIGDFGHSDEGHHPYIWKGKTLFRK